jgi:flagellar assembly protein FliH
MSRVLREERARLAASLGSFVVRRTEPAFMPLGNAEPYNDEGPKPLTSEQEKLRAQGEAYARGYDEARAAAEQELAAEREAIARLAASLEVLRPEPTNALALLLAETVDRLVREIVGTVEIDAGLLLARAKAAAALIGENVEPSKLIVHPDDIALLEPAGLAVELVGDPSLVRGTVILETGHGWVEDGPAVRLERLRAELDKLATPQ